MHLTTELLLTRLCQIHPEMHVYQRQRQEERRGMDQLEQVSWLPDVSLDRIEHALRQIKYGKRDTLYMAPGSYVLKNNNLPKALPIVCFSAEPEQMEPWPDVTVVQTQMDAHKAGDAFMACFQDFTRWEQTLLQLYRQGDYQGLVDATEHLLQIPILLLDRDMQVLGISEHCRHPSLAQIQRGDRLESSYACSLRQAHAFSLMRDGEMITLPPPPLQDEELQAHYAACVEWHNSVELYCVMINTCQYPEALMQQMLRNVCHAAGSRYRFLDQGYNAEEVALLGLMGPSDQSRRMVDAGIANTRLRSPDAWFLVGTLHGSDARLLTDLRAWRDYSYAFAWEDHLVVVLQMRNVNTQSEQRMDTYRQSLRLDCEAFLRKHACTGAMCFSRVFQDMGQFRAAHAQCECLQELAKVDTLGQVLFFTEEIVPTLFQRSRPSDLMFSYCEPTIFESLRSQSTHVRHEMNILDTWLVNDRRTTDTSEALQTHRNNVTYHVKKLETSLEVDFNDRGVRERYRVSFDLLRYLGLWE